jgi:hypothetical protein
MVGREEGDFLILVLDCSIIIREWLSWPKQSIESPAVKEEEDGYSDGGGGC